MHDTPWLPHAMITLRRHYIIATLLRYASVFFAALDIFATLQAAFRCRCHAIYAARCLSYATLPYTYIDSASMPLMIALRHH